MDNGYSVLLHLHDKSKEAKAFADKLEEFVCDYTFLRQKTGSNVRHLPLLVIVASSCSREMLQEIDQDITNQSHQGVVIIVYFRTHPSEQIAKIENNFNVIRYIVAMDFKDGTLQNFEGARKKIRSACEENRSRQFKLSSTNNHGTPRTKKSGNGFYSKGVKNNELSVGMVLLYDPEKGNTSSAFTEALGKFITKLRFQHFEDATEEERHSYPILVVVRSTTVRFDEDLKQTAVLLEGLLGDLERVIAVYFQMNPVDSSRKHIESNSKGYNFWKIIDMDFSGTTFGQYRFNIFGFQFLNEEKPINVRAREEILLAYESLLNRNVTSVGVYYKKTLYAAGQFLEALGKLVYPRIHLRPAQHIDMLTHTNSATVVYLTSPSDIIEKNTFTDSRKVVVFRIFEVDTDNINGNKDDEPTLHPQPSVTQPLREVFIPCTEQYNCKFGRTFNILLGKDGLILCSLTMLKEFETFISECNSKQFK